MAITIQEKHRLLLRLDTLIRAKTRGRSKDLAAKLGIHEATLFRLLEYAKEELKAPIMFDADSGRYIYATKGFIYFGFLPEEAVDPKKLSQYIKCLDRDFE